MNPHDTLYNRFDTASSIRSLKSIFGAIKSINGSVMSTGGMSKATLSRIGSVETLRTSGLPRTAGTAGTTGTVETQHTK